MVRNLNFDLFCPSVLCLPFIDFVIDSFSNIFLSLAEMCLNVYRSSPTDRACCIVFFIQDFGFAACSISLRLSGFLIRSVVA